jgi:hypothetical protein
VCPMACPLVYLLETGMNLVVPDRRSVPAIP